jgi:nicotinate-nucleotide adenylyltransferase
MARGPERRRRLSVARLLRSTATRARRRHCRGTARLAGGLARRFGVDPAAAYLAALAHDLARDLPEAELLRLGRLDGGPVAPWEEERPVLLHGRAGAVLLEEQGAVDDPQIRAAVADHVTGRPGMSRLARIVFAADFLEPGRRFVGRELRRRARSLSLDRLTALVLERVLEHLRAEGLAPAPPALALQNELARG